MSFDIANQDKPWDPRDKASLQPKQTEYKLKRDSQMPWAPDLFLDATEWVQRAALGDPKAMQEVVLVVAPALLEEIKRLRRV